MREEDLVRRLSKLERKFDGLVQPEILWPPSLCGIWLDSDV